MTSENDGRLAVVAAMLGDEWQRKHFSTEGVAEAILVALDRRALVTKWEGPRARALGKTDGRWIPLGDLLEYLNTLPGARLTTADLKAKIRDPDSYYEHGSEPELQADCIRVFKREKQAGTEFLAIMDVIYDEVLQPARDKANDERRSARQQSRAKLVQSGRNFGFIPDVDTNKKEDLYSRHANQLYRLCHVAPKQYALFCVDEVGQEGTPAEPRIFRKRGDARDAIQRRNVNCAKRAR